MGDVTELKPKAKAKAKRYEVHVWWGDEQRGIQETTHTTTKRYHTDSEDGTLVLTEGPLITSYPILNVFKWSERELESDA